MTAGDVTVFLVAYATAAAFPGPGLAALIGRALSRGSGGLSFYILGFVVGDLFWFAAAALGLSLLAKQFGMLMMILRYAGAAYLFYLAYRLLRASPELLKPDALHARSSPLRNLVAGLTLTLGNPKVIVFFVALLPSVIDVRRMSFVHGLELAIGMAAVLSLILGSYAFLAVRGRRLLNRSRRFARCLNVGGAAIMAGAGVAVAAR